MPEPLSSLQDAFGWLHITGFYAWHDNDMPHTTNDHLQKWKKKDLRRIGSSSLFIPPSSLFIGSRQGKVSW